MSEYKDPTPEQVKSAVDEIANETWNMIHLKAKSIGLSNGNEMW